jgi:hypothetical protein
MTMERITSQARFIALSGELGVRSDWHEPDEQGVTAEVRGVSFDNAGTWPHDVESGLSRHMVEMHVVLQKDGEDVAAVNLATLCSWASGMGH